VKKWRHFTPSYFQNRGGKFIRCGLNEQVFCTLYSDNERYEGIDCDLALFNCCGAYRYWLSVDTHPWAYRSGSSSKDQDRSGVFGNWNISVGIETRLRAGRPGFSSQQGQWYSFSLPLCSDLLWGPPNLLTNGYRGGFFPWVWCGRDMNLITRLQLLPKLWMYGATPPHTDTSEWRGT
jgi:hypothetical protein